MGVSKLVIDGVTQLDMTNNTITAADLRSGVTAHGPDGEPVVGTMQVQTIYTGSTAPSDSLGSDGDIYLKLVE